MSRGFDWIAPYYDFLARMVFGNTIRRCQVAYLDKVPSGAKVLILGGGTGWILTELFKLNPTCRVWYVEASVKMLEKAKVRSEVLLSSQVIFIHGTERNLAEMADTRFDAVITNFYFDLFTSKSLPAVLENITRVIHPGSKLLVSEFIEGSRWQRLMLFIMYQFFNRTCSIEASRLPDWQGELKRHKFTERNETTFSNGFIKSSLYVFD
jgi:ubiquinone/menaquinone biosynthesis C-methylase UbiE